MCVHNNVSIGHTSHTGHRTQSSEMSRHTHKHFCGGGDSTIARSHDRSIDRQSKCTVFSNCVCCLSCCLHRVWHALTMAALAGSMCTHQIRSRLEHFDRRSRNALVEPKLKLKSQRQQVNITCEHRRSFDRDTIAMERDLGEREHVFALRG